MLEDRIRINQSGGVINLKLLHPHGVASSQGVDRHLVSGTRPGAACKRERVEAFGAGLVAERERGGSSARDHFAVAPDDLSAVGDAAGCLRVTSGSYPTVSLTELGGEVMRERANVELALSETQLSSLATVTFNSSPAPSKAKAKSASTIDETYDLYNEGLSIEEICQHRGLTAFTVEKHLAECIMQGRLFDISRHVSDADRALIEIAIDQLGTQLLRPLRDALPPHINYRMIRFVVADVQRAEQSR